MYFEVYKNFGYSSKEEIINIFFNTLISTNRTYDFFVNWTKIKQKIDDYLIEINTLNSLIRINNFDEAFKKVVKRCPSVLKVFPLLLAIRNKNLEIIEDIEKINSIKKYDFSVNNPTQEDIDNFLLFFQKTGLKSFFTNIADKSIYDYLVGLEVGLDTHARKNRSGNIMELSIKSFLKNLENKYQILYQKSFSYIQDFGIKVINQLKNRKADFIIINVQNKKVINIETNFYDSSGSKPQEIVDSYINRQKELKNNGFHFIWISDGKGWKKQKEQLLKAFDQIDYILNLNLALSGLLSYIINYTMNPKDPK
jgi:type II restriction enzyme